ncbi:NAD(P)-dependent alcohol dehydrogenase [Hyphomicrobium sp.]|jgi:NADPH:quinone reductase-like Zn-dependent oxidoreductase|uniref:zinc-dependent alcohol dehydrogenase family protein n=1 Tax=Hyphomicrobium sp. TaxID=82 RepID=UPI002B82BAC4|nr:NAD(P)-dependent alcohol dehydrogenase [Hyphomicrobium sp.]HVZ04429.1 NAD(P)-dependent alcohol dehydrogenase [Hyphomicrobium sp.]
MKTYLLQRFGVDGLAIKDAPIPEPGPGQVLVKMRAWSLNYRDVLVVRGIYAPKLRLPFQILSDGVGEVVATGAGVTQVKVGERVAGAFMQKWVEGEPDAEKSESALGGAIPGVAAEYVVLDSDGAVPVPEHLSDEEAATLPCAAVTAWHALVSSGKLAAGETVLVQGTGAVSIFALQFARMLGARVIATSSSDAKLERVRALGASDVINYKTRTEWGRQARELTGRRGVDHVVEVGGAGTLPQSLEAVRIGGRISLIGVLTGGAVNPIPVLMKNITVQGIYVGSRAMFDAMNNAIAVNGLKPIIDRVFSFDELPQALKHMESGAHFGKIVVKV